MNAAGFVELLRSPRRRVTITSSLLSPPPFGLPDETVPSLRDVRGFVCPRCRRSRPSPGVCPDDATPLIRAHDFANAEGDPLIGKTFGGRYTLLACLGTGAMAKVYRARDERGGRDVAVKVLRRDRASDPVSIAHFEREARASGILSSPHTVTFFGVGTSETEGRFLVMELLEGESLGERLARRTRLDVTEALDVAFQALHSLAEAHARGIVHRDLKPDNVFCAGDVVKVLDFGIATFTEDENGGIAPGVVFGTPRYMSPEQARGLPLDARSDLYSLGVILYQCLTGRPPFEDEDSVVVMAQHIRSAPRPPSEVCPDAHIPPELDAIVMRMLAKDPSERPQSANELMPLLEGVRARARLGTPRRTPTRARSRGYWAAGLVIAALLVGGLAGVLTYVSRTSPPAGVEAQSSGRTSPPP